MVGEFLPTPSNFRIGRHLTAWTLYNKQQANIGTRYVVARAYSLEQQNNRIPGGLTLGFAMHLVISNLLISILRIAKMKYVCMYVMIINKMFCNIRVIF